MQLVSGEVQINGRVALVSQQAWIYNNSLRNNLLMGMPYNQAKYDAMIENCALTTDIQLLPDGDSSEIGDKGINLRWFWIQTIYEMQLSVLCMS